MESEFSINTFPPEELHTQLLMSISSSLAIQVHNILISQGQCDNKPYAQLCMQSPKDGLLVRQRSHEFPFANPISCLA